jgi:hypothetical protein
MEGRDRLGYLHVDEVVNYIRVAHGRDQWRALLNTVMNLRVP